MIDLTGLPLDELEALRDAIMQELGRRVAQQQTLTDMESMQRTELGRLGVREDGEWRQPTHALDAFPRGWVTVHAGRRWRSLIDANVTTPGEDPLGRWWEDLGPVEDEPDDTPDESDDTPAAWAVGVSYTVGDVVTHDGATWRCLLAHTSHVGWAPSPATHAVWTKED